MKTRILPLLITLLIPAIILLPFVLIDLQPDGELVTTLKSQKVSPFLKSPLPQDRVDISGNSILIFGDPVYLNIIPPRSGYDEVEFTFKYRPQNIKIFEFGPQMNIFTESFDLRPVYSDLLQGLADSDDWNYLNSTDGSIFTRKDYDNYHEAKSDLELGNFLTYRYEVDHIPFRLDGYIPDGRFREYEVDLRGSHTFLTYIKDETLNLELELTDMNRVLGEDKVDLRIFNEREVEVYHAKLAEDGNDSMNQIVTPKTLSVSVPDLPEGVYEISLETTTDIFTRKIKTTQNKFVFKNKLFMADSVGWREAPVLTRAFTDATQFSVQTLHNDGLQTLTIGEDQIIIDEIQERKNIEIDSGGLKTVSAPAANLEIISNGVIALTESSYFSPLTPTINAWTEIGEIIYPNIITSYSVPEKEGEYYISSVDFDLATIPRNDAGAMRFIISLPNLEDGGVLEVKEIKATFKRAPIRGPADLINFVKDRL